jgi:predicted polyphosphate/ATP-dependent NAD kinase
VKRLGLIVNPIAGMGGKVGLKGTDGEEVLARAIALGARSESTQRAETALRRLRAIGDSIRVFSGPGELGGGVAEALNLPVEILDVAIDGPTTAEHTREVAVRLQELGVDLLLFAGGDGTARDIAQVIEDRLVVLGIPTGVKMHSAVFAVNPARAGDLATSWLGGEVVRTRLVEVMDIDEDLLREGRVAARLFGYSKIPDRPRHTQGLKATSPAGEESSQRSIAAEVVEKLEDDVNYVVGPGTTTGQIMQKLNLESTLVGVDLLRNRALVVKDASEQDLLAHAFDRSMRVIVTPIGGQGYLFGRGNQQISARILRQIGRDNVMVVATPDKLSALRGRPMLIDTGDRKVDDALVGYYKVVTGYRAESVYLAAC